MDAIESMSSFVKANEANFVKQVRETSTIQQDEAAKSHKRRIAKEQKRTHELDTLIRRIYEDNVSGKLIDKRFELLSMEYEQEQTELEQSIGRLQSELNSFHSDSARADNFIEIVKKHTDFSELTPQMIAEYIEKSLCMKRTNQVGHGSRNKRSKTKVHNNKITTA